MSRLRRPLAACLSLGAFALVLVAGCNGAAHGSLVPPTRLPLVTHAAFFSSETKLSPVLDPQVFVREAASPAAVGPQHIARVAGFRNALVTDPRDSELYTAMGARLDGFTLGSWLDASGSVELAGTQIAVDLAGLRPGGLYSLFENHFDESPVGFTPLDGSGTSNTVVADAQGRAHLAVTAPRMLTHDNAVLVVYHSDGMAHGASRGTIGVNAHHQLIVRIP